MVYADDDILKVEILTPDRPGFADACGQVAQLLGEREAEFHFNPETHRPAISAVDFLADPAGTILPAITGDGLVAILTTWSDVLAPMLIAQGFQFRPITWPAGPLNSGIFNRGGDGRAIYIELVNEDAPEIAPSHVLRAFGINGFVGGTITTVRGDAAWLAVMCVKAQLPKGAGSQIWEALVTDLVQRGVGRLDLGTQTAERFYTRCGTTIADRVISRLRWRDGTDGPVWNDLVMMTIDL